MAHCIIYTKKIQIDILKKNRNNIIHWDYFLTTNYTNYFYRYPLCYQIFPKTDNQKEWFKNDPLKKFNEIKLDLVLNILKLNKKPEPGFTIMYTLLFIFNNLILIFLIFLIFMIIYYINIKN